MTRKGTGARNALIGAAAVGALLSLSACNDADLKAGDTLSFVKGARISEVTLKRLSDYRQMAYVLTVAKDIGFQKIGGRCLVEFNPWGSIDQTMTLTVIGKATAPEYRWLVQLGIDGKPEVSRSRVKCLDGSLLLVDPEDMRHLDVIAKTMISPEENERLEKVQREAEATAREAKRKAIEAEIKSVQDPASKTRKLPESRN